MNLESDLQEENTRLLAANKDCLAHFEAIKRDYDEVMVKLDKLTREHIVAMEYDTRVINMLRAKLKIAKANLKLKD